MTKAKLILIAAFIVTLAAGVVAGYTLRSLTHGPLRSSLGGSAPRDPAAISHHEHFPDLNLTAEQKAKMDEIWGAVMRTSRETQGDQHQGYQKEREAAVIAMLAEEQKTAYDRILKDYASKMADLRKARDKAFQEAVEKTKLILNAKQQKKYEDWLKGWHDDRHPGGAPPMEPTPPAKIEKPTATGSGR